MEAPSSSAKKSAVKAGPRGLLRKLGGAAKSVVLAARGRNRQPASKKASFTNEDLARVLEAQQELQSSSCSRAAGIHNGALPDKALPTSGMDSVEEDLVAMGFNRADARAALQLHGNDVQKAAESLLQIGSQPAQDRHQMQQASERCKASASESSTRTPLREAACASDSVARKPCRVEGRVQTETVEQAKSQVAPKGSVPQRHSRSADSATDGAAKSGSTAASDVAPQPTPPLKSELKATREATPKAATFIPKAKPSAAPTDTPKEVLQVAATKAAVQRSLWTCSVCDEENGEQRSSCNNCGKAKPAVAERTTSRGMTDLDPSKVAGLKVTASKPSVDESKSAEAKQVLSDAIRNCEGTGDQAEVHRQTDAWGMSNILHAFVSSSVAPVTGCSASMSHKPGDNRNFRSSFISSSLPTTEEGEVGTSAPRQLSQASREFEHMDGEAVWLNIYDVSGNKTQWMNDLVRHLGTGAFHAGVEVYGQEWSFGYNAAGSGVYNSKPRSCGQHKYRESVAMGATSLSQAAVQALIAELRTAWPGKDYELLVRNCCHFSDALCRGLGVGSIPEWVMHLAGAGRSFVDGVDQAVKNTVVAAELAATKAGELDEKYRISGSVDAFLSKEVTVDEEKIEAAVQDIWAKTVAGFTNMGAFAEGVLSKAMMGFAEEYPDPSADEGTQEMQLKTAQSVMQPSRRQSVVQPNRRLPPSPTRGHVTRVHPSLEPVSGITPLQTQRIVLPRAAEEESIDPTLPVTPAKAKKPTLPPTPETLKTSDAEASPIQASDEVAAASVTETADASKASEDAAAASATETAAAAGKASEGETATSDTDKAPASKAPHEAAPGPPEAAAVNDTKMSTAGVATQPRDETYVSPQAGLAAPSPLFDE